MKAIEDKQLKDEEVGVKMYAASKYLQSRLGQ